ncbi:MAG: dihydrolipoamide acetyltransferase family protein [Saccharofermentanales bacterium]|jgi:pyruvate dehydrogenase E2 component (dihydrolipoamide acetyltransferase)
MKEIKMPPGGQNVDELMITTWEKSEGDQVKRGDVLLTVETDKAAMDVESFASGTLLKIFYEEGDMVKIGEVIALVGNPDEIAKIEKPAEYGKSDIQSPAAQVPVSAEDEYQPIMPAATDTAEKESTPEIKSSDGFIRVSPAAKKLIRDLNLNIEDIEPVKGKISQKDVENYLNKIETKEEESDFQRIPLTNARKTISKRLTTSVQERPTFHAEVEVDCTNIIKLRKDIFEKYQKKVSYNDIISKSLVNCINKYPLINAKMTEQDIIVFNSVNVGIAVALEENLIVPVVKNVEKLTILEIAEINSANINIVRSGKYNPEITQNGTITISNMGMYNISRFTAILNPPEVTILAIGNINKKAVWDEVQEKFMAKPMMTITGTFDHRVVDGAYGAKFLSLLKELLENPLLMLA